MATGLLLLIYVSFICLAWGLLAARLLSITGLIGSIRYLAVPVLCICGASILMMFGNLISWFWPLDNWILQAAMLLVSITAILSNRSLIRSYLPKFSRHSKPDLLLLGLGILMLVLLLQHHSHSIVHPDTLAYHAPIIRWIEKYPQIPGIANLNSRLGLQSSWFVGSSMFSYSFLGLNSIGFLNLAVLSWFVLFLLLQIRNAIEKKNWSSALICLLLLAITWGNYTQIRLTASSASPDFITAIYILLIIFLFWRIPVEQYRIRIPLLLLLGATAVAIKLSAIPILILPLILFVLYFKTIGAYCIRWATVFFLLIILPVLARNYMASGYPVYPSAVLSVNQPDWIIQKGKQLYDYKNVSAYARMQPADDSITVFKVADAPLNYWLPAWWKLRASIDKAILLLGTLLLTLCIITGFRWFRKQDYPLILTLAGGCIFWFLFAPDPRFGYGFLMGLAGVLIFRFPGIGISQLTFKRITLASLTLLFFLVVALTVYRFGTQYEKGQLIFPKGLSPVPYHISSQGIVEPTTIPCLCGGLPQPCSCTPREVEWRGNSVLQGFRRKVTP